MAKVLASSTPIAEATIDRVDRRFRIRLRGYTNDVDLPDEFLGSVRVIVLVGGRVVVCINADGKTHPWPGGRREAGESLVETACREVHEETGWILESESLRRIGWLHFEHLLDRPPEHSYLHADFFNVVYVGAAADRDGGVDNEWTDTEGFELSSRLVALDEALAEMDGDDAQVARAFLELARHA